MNFEPRAHACASCFPEIVLTDRLVLRAPHPEDREALASLADNIRVASMLSRLPHPYRPEHADAFLARSGNGMDGFFAVTLAANGAFIGMASLEPAADGVTELGYWLGEPFWGRGYATEAVTALVDHAFRTRELEVIRARCRADNLRSRRVLHKTGFRPVGNTRIHSLAAGEQDGLAFVLSRRHRFGAISRSV